jgi:hypothetical protein
VNGYIKLAKMRQHLTSVHPESVSKVEGLIRANKFQFEKSGTFPELGFAIYKSSFLKLTGLLNKRRSTLLERLK